MTSAFDPYYKWLGIPADEQPADHYRLLGLRRFESDPEVIQAAADQRMAHVRNYASGPHSELSQRLLNEIAAAKLQLLDPKKKLDYDQALRAQMAALQQPPQPQVPVAAAIPLGTPLKASPSLKTRAAAPFAPVAPPLPIAQVNPASAIPDEIVEYESSRSPLKRPGRAVGSKSSGKKTYVGLAGSAIALVIAAGFIWSRTGDTPQAQQPNPPAAKQNAELVKKSTEDKSRSSSSAAIKSTDPSSRPKPQDASASDPNPDKLEPTHFDIPDKVAKQPRDSVASNAVNLLANIDPVRNAVSGGGWKMERGVLVAPAGLSSVFEVPCNAPDEYELTMNFERPAGLGSASSMFLVSLWSGAAPFRVIILDHNADVGGGMDYIDGAEWSSNATTYRTKRYLREGIPSTVKYIIRRTGVKVLMDNKTVIDWQGDRSRLGNLDAGSLPRDRNHIRIVAFAAYRISKLELWPIGSSDADPELINVPNDQPLRAPSPSTEQQQAARKLLRETLADALAKGKKPEERMKLAGEFLARGREIRESSADRYVLLDEARKLATEAGNYTLAIEAVEELATTFDVNAGALRTEALLESAKKAKTASDYQAATQAALDLVDEAEEVLDWERASQLVKAAVSFSAKARDLDLAKTAKDRSQALNTRKKLGDEAAAARATLDTNPNDPEANLTLGQYLCLVRQDWKAGLPLLAKSGDERLKAGAASELMEPTGAADMLRLADRWWDIAGTQSEEQRKQFLAHAAEWYERATDAGLHDIDIAKATKRIEEASGIGGRENREQWISYAATCTASSAHAGWVPTAALLTGRGALYYENQMAFHTGSQAGAHVTIDLGTEKTVRRLEIENRRGGANWEISKAKNMVVWLSSQAGERGQQVWRATEALPRWNVVLPKPVRARYVTLGYPPDHTDYFHLASVKVFGSESVSLRGPSGTGRVRATHRALGYPLREHPADAVGFRGHWYKYFNNSVDPYEAQRQCAAMGGYLVCLETEDEYQFIRKSPQKTGCFGLYKGANGKWSWINGAPLTIDHWAPGEPSGDAPTAVFGTGEWNDAPGAGTYVCEWEY